MGSTRMKCKKCENTDINEMLVEYIHIAPNKKIFAGTTTLPKFLYETMYPERPKLFGAAGSLLIEPRQLIALRITKIICTNCTGVVEIKPTRYGI